MFSLTLHTTPQQLRGDTECNTMLFNKAWWYFV